MSILGDVAAQVSSRSRITAARFRTHLRSVLFLDALNLIDNEFGIVVAPSRPIAQQRAKRLCIRGDPANDGDQHDKYALVHLLDERGRTPLMMICDPNLMQQCTAACEDGTVHCMVSKLLLLAGRLGPAVLASFLNRMDNTGQTALHSAIHSFHKGHPQPFWTLVNSQAFAMFDLETKSNAPGGCTVFGLAVIFDEWHCAHVLLEMGSDPNCCETGDSQPGFPAMFSAVQNELLFRAMVARDLDLNTVYRNESLFGAVLAASPLANVFLMMEHIPTGRLEWAPDTVFLDRLTPERSELLHVAETCWIAAHRRARSITAHTSVLSAVLLDIVFQFCNWILVEESKSRGNPTTEDEATPADEDGELTTVECETVDEVGSEQFM